MNTDKKEKSGMTISTRSFLTAIIVILVLMIAAYLLTFLIPGGQYERIYDADGNEQIDMEAGFRTVEGGLPFYKWILSPFLILGWKGNTTLIAVICLLLIIGGAFRCLEKCNFMQYMLDKIVHRYGARRYTLLSVVTFFFMALGAFAGSFEECVPLVPIVVALSLRLGWDALTGIGMSLIAVGCGFSSGILNPFTVGVAQTLAGVPMFSGIWLRLLSGALIYCLLLFFLRWHAKRVEKPIDEEILSSGFVNDPKMDRALFAFACILGAGIATVLCSIFVTALQDLTMIVVVVMFLVAGVVSSLLAGMKTGDLLRTFLAGAGGILPAVLMILMAGSIRYILEEGNVLDTILHAAAGLAESLPPAVVILFLYLVVLVMNFFIASGSAKAFLLIPLIVPIAGLAGIPAQLCILAFAYGDGFSNVFYPTNPTVLISLGLVDVSYGTYARWSVKFQLLNLLLTSLILLFGLAVGYC